MGLVRAAYSAGKPAYGVGPGNAPAYIERSADVAKAVRDIVTGKTFDNGVLCSSRELGRRRRAARRGSEAAVRRQRRALSVRRARSTRSRACSSRPQRLPNPALVGRPATYIAQQAGITVAADDARADRGARRASAATIRCRSRSSARSCPSMSSPTGARAASAASRSCATAAWATRCPSTRRNDEVILQFGLKKPAFRIVVNSPTTHGSIGLTTGLDPAMTLGCGGCGGNITSDNISPRHLLNIKRLAYEIDAGRRAPGRPRAATPADAAGLPKAPAAPAPAPRHRRRPAGPADRRVPRVAGLRGAGSQPELARSRARTPPPAAPRPPAPKPATPTRPAGREAARVRLRRRRAAGAAAGSQDRHRRADDRDAGGARPRRAAPSVRRRPTGRADQPLGFRASC